MNVKKALTNLLHWMLRTQVTAYIYMKSGSVIKLTNLEKINIKKSGCQVTEMTWEQGFRLFGRCSILNINLDEIEAVICYR